MAKKHKLFGIFDDIVEYTNVCNAYQKAISGDGKYKYDAIRFSEELYMNIEKLIRSLRNDTYEFSGYHIFNVYEPKERVIAAPFFVDKIVQLSINNILKTFYNKKFIYDSYSCIDEKGTHKAAKRIFHNLREAHRKYGDNAYIIKIDIKKFFYTIDRKILKDILKRDIGCERTLKLLFKIIDSANLISPLGLPLGNTLSQLCSNIYMNEVDQYTKRSLSIKYYVRYADDMIIVVKNKGKAVVILSQLTEFINNNLKLELNMNKTKIFPIKQGVNAIGFKINTTHMGLRDMSKSKIKKKVKAFPSLVYTGQITIHKAEQMLNSWKGPAEHSNSFNFIKYLIKRFPYIYLNEDNVLKIDIWEINLYMKKSIREFHIENKEMGIAA